MLSIASHDPDRTLRYHALYFAVGFAPISALALCIFGLWTLPVGTVCFTLPVILIGVLLADRNPEAARNAAKGFCCGVIAVLIYDLSRWTLSAHLGLVDFIPNIGGWLLSTDEPQWMAGYLWRYIGNGGGMGVGFASLMAIWKSLPISGTCRLDRRALGVLYGIGIWLCLLITLIVSPRGEAMMFPLTAQYFWVTLIGHVVYGAVLGLTIETRFAPWSMVAPGVNGRVAAAMGSARA